MVAVVTPLVQEGVHTILTIPNLGGQTRAAPVFQVFLTQSEQLGSMREELAKMVRTQESEAGGDDCGGRKVPQAVGYNREDNENVFHHHQPPQPYRVPSPDVAGQQPEILQAGKEEGPGEVAGHPYQHPDHPAAGRDSVPRCGGYS